MTENSEGGVERRTGERRIGAGDRRTGAASEALVTGLMETAADLTRMGQDLIRASALTRLQRWFLFAVLTVGAAGTVSAAIDGVLILHGQQQTHATQRLISDCTTPGGACYQRSERQAGQAVAVLQKYMVITLECARESDDQHTEACIARKMHEQGLAK